MKRTQLLFTSLVAALLLLCGCGRDVESEPRIGMANPASVYCAELGGKSEPVTTQAGQSSNCHLPDGRVVEEWALYRSAHAVEPTSVATPTAADK
ncbi:MAG: putative hemolysin [Aeromonadaceae bacterium]